MKKLQRIERLEEFQRAFDTRLTHLEARAMLKPAYAPEDVAFKQPRPFKVGDFVRTKWFKGMLTCLEHFVGKEGPITSITAEGSIEIANAWYWPASDLSGAYLSDAYLRGADLSGALNIICLPVGDPRGYRPVAVWFGDHWVIYSGCRQFTIAEAREHWGDAYKGERSTGDQYLYACDWLVRQPTPEAKDRKVKQ
jgi:hypothetical protein